MIKGVIASFLTLPIFILTYFLAAEVNVNQEAPSAAEPNSTFQVTVTIDKEDINGFAKYQFNVPNGVTVQEADNNGSTFTFNNQQAKFIWLSLPTEKSFSFTYEVVLEASAPENFTLEGTFSYLENNERKSVDVNYVTVTVGEGATEAMEPEAVEVVVDAKREIKDLGNNKYEISVALTKQGIEGFGKLEEFVPEGAKAEEGINQNKGVFTYLGKKVKFVWVALPDTSNFKISYILDLSDAVNPIPNQLKGEFAYLEDGKTAKIDVEGLPFEAASEAVADNTNQPIEETSEETIPVETLNEALTEMQSEEELASEEERPEETTTEEEVAEASQTEETISVEDLNKQLENAQNTTEEEAAEASTNQTTASTIPNPETGVSYKVQIVAGHKIVPKNHISRVYKYSGDYYTENHEGWIKYTVGGFPVYRNARDERVKLSASYNFPGPFVTAYNNGERITVQEALMISNQKWIK